MSASCQSIDSAFELRPIHTCAKFKPVKESETEVPSVELITELVELQLKELCFYVMVRIRYASYLKVLPKSRMGKAIEYTYTLLPRLSGYVNDGRIEIDDNRIENAIRPLALERIICSAATTHPHTGLPSCTL